MRSTGLAGLTVRKSRVALSLLAVGVSGAALVAQAPGSGANGSMAPSSATTQSLFPAPNQFLYVRSRGAYLTCKFEARARACWMQPRRLREVWVSERREGLLVERPAGVLRRPSALGPRRIYLGNRRFTHRAMATYAPTGAQLLAELQEGRAPGQGSGGASYPYVQLTDALREAAMPAKVRQAIIDALALVPGVAQLGKRSDALGRPGIGFARTLPDAREEVIVDPASLVMLEERTILLKASAAPGAGKRVGEPIGGALYLARAVVDRAGQRPSQDRASTRERSRSREGR